MGLGQQFDKHDQTNGQQRPRGGQFSFFFFFFFKPIYLFLTLFFFLYVHTRGNGRFELVTSAS
jgi:hypothetical protein